MKLVVYGLGKAFKLIFEDIDFYKKVILERGYNVSFMDKNKVGVEIEFNDAKYTVKKFDITENYSETLFLVTSDKFFAEIKIELIEKGLKETQIIRVDEFVDMYLNSKVGIDLFEEKRGIEIGGPSDIFKSIYNVCESCDGVNFSTDTIWWGKKSEKYEYKNKSLGKVIISDVTDLSEISDNSYDFVISSNNLEHVANPMKAVAEMKRVVKSKAPILIVVPKKEDIFDHNRPYTTYNHIVSDYKSDIGEDDKTHLPEILNLHDFDMDVLCGGREAFELRSRDNINNRCLHHHVFSEDVLREIYKYFNIEILDTFTFLGNYWIVGEKR